MSQPENAHLTPEELAAYLDGDLQAGERARIEAHLADCQACLDEVAVIDRLARAKPGRSLRPRYVQAAVACAAAAVVLFLALPDRPLNAPDELRTPATGIDSGASTLGALEPIGVVTAEDGIILRWEAASAGTLYRIALLDSVGSVLWNAETRESSLPIPPEIRERLQPGASYFWRADALLPDLRTATTGDQPFSLSR